MFYQAQHSLDSDLLKIEQGVDLTFPPHLHGSFECIAVTEGEMTVVVDKIQHRVAAGEALLVFPNQVHELITKGHSAHVLCIFSAQLVRAYANRVSGKLPNSAIFTPDPFYVARLKELFRQNDLLRAKGLLYSLCAEFDASTSYRDRGNEKKDLLASIFQFIERNYRADCSLEALSRATSYHAVYLSRYFKHYTALTYTDYVIHYRIKEASYILKNTNQKIIDVAYSCGFDSLRSFNRNFKNILKTTPGEYRKGTDAPPQ